MFDEVCARVIVWPVLLVGAVLPSCTEASTSADLVPSSSPSTFPPGRLVELDAGTGEVLREVDVGPDPLLAVGASGAVWTLNLDDSTVTRVDATTGIVSQPDAGEAVGIASDGSGVWVATDRRRLVRLDGATGAVEEAITLSEEPLFGPRDAGFVVVAAGSVWVTIPPSGPEGRQELWRVDPSDGSVEARIAIGSDPAPPVVAAGAVWMADDGEEVVRVDVDSERVSSLDLGPFPGAIAGGGDRVWAAVSGAILRLDPGSGRVLGEIAFAGVVRGLAWVRGRLWVATDTGVTIVDPRSGEVARAVELADPSDDEGPIALVPLGGSVFVTIETA